MLTVIDDRCNDLTYHSRKWGSPLQNAISIFMFPHFCKVYCGSRKWHYC